MFKITMSNVDLLRNTIPVIAEIIDEGVFNVTQNGLTLLSPDRTMVSVVDFKLLSTAFDEFKVDSDVSLGLNMANFSAIIKRLRPNDKLGRFIDMCRSQHNFALRTTVYAGGLRTDDGCTPACIAVIIPAA